MNGSIIPFPSPKSQLPMSYVTRDGEFVDDELPPELFDQYDDMNELSL